MSSVPDSELGAPGDRSETSATDPGPGLDNADVKDNIVKQSPASSLTSPPGPGGLSPGVGPPHGPPRVKPHRGQLTPQQGPGLSPMSGSKTLTSLANLSPTPKSLLTGKIPRIEILKSFERKL